MHSERQSSEQKRFSVELLLQMASQVSKPESACAACKFQKKKCSDKCVLAPYFPQKDLKKFLLVHRLFGYGHVVKLLQVRSIALVSTTQNIKFSEIEITDHNRMAYGHVIITGSASRAESRCSKQPGV